MARSGTTFGTVVRWDEEHRTGLIEAPDLPGPVLGRRVRGGTRS